MIQFFKDLAAAIAGINELIDKLNAGAININLNITINGESVVLAPAPADAV